MQVQQLEQSPICCNALISACDKGGQWQLALAFLHRAWFDLVLACRLSFQMRPIHSQAVVCIVCDDGRCKAETRNADWSSWSKWDPWLQHSLTKLRNQSWCWDWFASFFQRNTRGSTSLCCRFCYNSAISACARSSQWQTSIGLLDEVISLAMIPTETWIAKPQSNATKTWYHGADFACSIEQLETWLCAGSYQDMNYNSAISACERGFDVSRSWSLVEVPCFPVLFLHPIVDLCSKSGIVFFRRWVGIGTVPSQGHEKHETVLHCLELHGLIFRDIFCDIYSKPMEGGKKPKHRCSLKVNLQFSGFSAAISACEGASQLGPQCTRNNIWNIGGSRVVRYLLQLIVVL